MLPSPFYQDEQKDREPSAWEAPLESFDENAVRRLISDGEEGVNSSFFPLVEFTERSFVEGVRLLLETNKVSLIQLGLAFLKACKIHSPILIKLFVDHGVSMIWESFSPLCEVSTGFLVQDDEDESKRLQCFEILLQAGAKLTGPKMSSERLKSWSFLAVNHTIDRNQPKLLRALIRQGADPDANGQLQYAGNLGYLGCIRALIEERSPLKVSKRSTVAAALISSKPGFPGALGVLIAEFTVFLGAEPMRRCPEVYQGKQVFDIAIKRQDIVDYLIDRYPEIYGIYRDENGNFCMTRYYLLELIRASGNDEMED